MKNKKETISHDQTIYNKYKKASLHFTLVFFSIALPIYCFISLIAFILSKQGFYFSQFQILLFGFFCLFLLCSVCGILMSYYTIHIFLTPLEQLRDAAQKVASGDYSVFIDHQSSEEKIQDIIDRFNQMVQNLNTVKVLHKDFIENVSHQLKTPLVSLAGYATLLQDNDLPEDEREEYLRMILLNIEKLNNITSDILNQIGN